MDNNDFCLKWRIAIISDIQENHVKYRQEVAFVT